MFDQFALKRSYGWFRLVTAKLTTSRHGIVSLVVVSLAAVSLAAVSLAAVSLNVELSHCRISEPEQLQCARVIL